MINLQISVEVKQTRPGYCLDEKVGEGRIQITYVLVLSWW